MKNATTCLEADDRGPFDHFILGFLSSGQV